MDERQAYETLNNPNRVSQWKIVGVCEGRMWGVTSDQMCPMGLEQIRILDEGMRSIQMVDPRIVELEESQRKYHQAIEDLVYKEFADPKKDERVERGRDMLEKVNKEIEKIKSATHPFGELNKRAMEAQLELCRGNIIYPSKASLVAGNSEAVSLLLKSKGI